MISSALSILVEITVATSLAVIVVALTIAPLRRMSGPQVAYWLWLLVPASALVVLLPLPHQALDAAQFLPPAIAGAFTVERTFEDGVQNGAIYPTVALVIWASGLLLTLTLMVIRQKLFTRSLRDLVLGVDGTYRCAAVTSPLLVGLRRARIIVPLDFDTRYDPEEQALIVAHERAHRQRGDILANAIAGAWLCVFWFNPLMYWAAIRLRVDQDLACDASVLRSSSAGPLPLRPTAVEGATRGRTAAARSYDLPVAICSSIEGENCHAETFLSRLCAPQIGYGADGRCDSRRYRLGMGCSTRIVAKRRAARWKSAGCDIRRSHVEATERRHHLFRQCHDDHD